MGLGSVWVCAEGEREIWLTAVAPKALFNINGKEKLVVGLATASAVAVRTWGGGGGDVKVSTKVVYYNNSGIVQQRWYTITKVVQRWCTTTKVTQSYRGRVVSVCLSNNRQSVIP